MQMIDAGTMKGGSRRYIMNAVEATLTRLKTDWIDLYQFHRPDPLTPIDETLRALDDLVRQGKVRYIGCSNMPAWQMADAHWTARDLGLAGFVSCQDEYSLLVRGAETRADPGRAAFRHGAAALFPARQRRAHRQVPPQCADARGRAPDQAAPARRARSSPKRTGRKIETLTDFCEARGQTLVELAFSWLAAQPVVSSVIAGATKPEQIAANVKAAAWALTAEELAEIDTITG